MAAVMRVHELEIERLSSQLAMANEARELAQRQLKDALQSGANHAKEYRNLVEGLAMCQHEHDTDLDDQKDQPSTSNIDWGSAILNRSSDILPRIIACFCLSGAFHSTEDLKISCVCRSLVSMDKEMVINLRPRLPKTTWRTIQFAVDDPSHFVLVVELSGTWGAHDSFRLGIAPASVHLDGEQGHSCGYWFSPKSGRLLGEDGSDCIVPALAIDEDRFRHRQGHGIERASFKGLGKGESARQFRKRAGKKQFESRQFARLTAGTVWVFHYRHRVLELFFARSCKHAFESLGPARFASSCACKGGMRQLQVDSDDYAPSLLCRCPVRDGPVGITSSRGHTSWISSSPSAILTVVHAASPASDVETLCLVGRTLESLGWCQGRPALCRRGRMAHAFQSWKFHVMAAPIHILRMCPRLRCLGPAMFELSQPMVGFCGSPYWIRVPINVDNPYSFRVAVRVEGRWLKHDEFLLGLEPNRNYLDSGGMECLSRMKIRRGPLGQFEGKPHPTREKVQDELLFNSRNGMLGEDQYYLSGLWQSRHYDSRHNRNDVGRSGEGLAAGHIWAMELRE
eukprot:CAMPEP_0180825882 /NCGR_PEP_ID=MMETSP1038_2-20121128/73219_1 /TAXON_ID=632150 /ORGANISM="Azadinium spinosum, Strain 3D9" /LENGTH=567 /DNA_ID=CAMNT_0022868397 /DNA_START=12 /DNA_END=1712 /DNA_ORIENTATION=+